MIRRFQTPRGKYIEKIAGQDRLAFAMSDQEDFHDLIAWSLRGGYQGSVILFYDLQSGDVWQPFEKKRDTVYGPPVFLDGRYYFLQGDYGENRITLFRYCPGETPEPVTVLRADEVELFNLKLIGNPLHIVSQRETFRCYYPEPFSFALPPNETVCLIEDGAVYAEAWVEEGWDEERNCATEAYDFYHKVRIRDFRGQLLSEEIGFLYQAPDGTWWIA